MYERFKISPLNGIFFKKKNKIEEQPTNISKVARMFGLKNKTIYHWYHKHLSDYLPDKENGSWCREKIPIEINETTGEIVKKNRFIYSSSLKILENVWCYTNLTNKIVQTIL